MLTVDPQQRAFSIVIVFLLVLAGCNSEAAPGESLTADKAIATIKFPPATVRPEQTIAPSASSRVNELPTLTGTVTPSPLPTATSRVPRSEQSNGPSSHPSLSADGRFVAFASAASNLVPGDTNQVQDVFVHDLQTGQTERVSAASDGTQGDDFSLAPIISADGRWVVYWSFASNLVSGDTEECGEANYSYNCSDVFVYDRQTGTVEWIAVGGTRGLGGGSSRLGSSADGRWVVFYSWASHVVTGDTNEQADIFVYDRHTGVIGRASAASGDNQSNGDSVEPAISTDGRWVVFVSWASNLVTDDTNAQADVFVYDRQTGAIERVSAASDGRQGDGASGIVLHQEGWSDGPSISPNGRWIAFASMAGNLVAGDINECENPVLGPHNCYDIFVFDREKGIIEQVSVASDGTPGDGESFSPSTSADGRWVVFVSSASNLVTGDTNQCPFSIGAGNCPDIFVHDRQTGKIERVSIANDGAQANDISSEPVISADGRWVAFVSRASNLIMDDNNELADIFVHDRLTGQIKRVSVVSPKLEKNRP